MSTGNSTDSPYRRCIASGRSKPQMDLIRFVVGPDGNVVPDLAERLPGRGMWLSADQEMVKTACRKGLFAKAARMSVVVPDGFEEVLEGLLRDRCLDHLGVLRRAGQATAGAEKVRDALAGVGPGDRALLVRARDAGRDAIEGGENVLRAPDALDGAELGRPFDRERVVQVCVTPPPGSKKSASPSGLADKLRRDLGRLAGLRGTEIRDWGDNGG